MSTPDDGPDQQPVPPSTWPTTPPPAGPVDGGQVGGPGPVPQAAGPKKPNPLTRKVGIPVWALIAAVFVFIVGLAAAAGPSDPQDGSTAAAESTTTAKPTATSGQAPATTTPATTASTTPTTAKPTTTTARPTTTTAAPLAPTVYEGSGTAVVTVKLAPSQIIVNASHGGSSNFIVKPVDQTGTAGSSLINEIGPYSGRLLVPDPTKVVALSVKADGPWRFEFNELRPGVTVNVAKVGEPYNGNGKDVVMVALPSTGLVKAAFTATASNFIVRPYDSSGRGSSSLVNEIAPWSGEVIVKNATVLLDVDATGPWTMTLTT